MWETARASFDGIAAAIGLALGFVAGACHFVSLGWNSRLFVAGRAGVALALQLARVALAVAVLVVLARAGFGMLVAGSAGFFAARAIAVRRAAALTGARR
ncbi:membrane protein [Burkholderia pseudomallei]|nr:N-ATPase, AtpR subunit [Burkholderia pseudomallei]VUD68282.1 membrane protein [Burkholderia pseudomallei]